MKKSKICAVITGDDRDAIKAAAKFADIFEVRIDLIGSAWTDLAYGLPKPWIATNRSINQHGNWQGDEETRCNQLVKAVDMGAWMVDIELESPMLTGILGKIKGRAKYMISYHDWEETPSLSRLEETVKAGLSAGAYACKVVTTARTLDDNITLLKLIHMFPKVRLVAFAMGSEGILSRIMSPIAGAFLTYASIEGSSASAPGQLTVEAMREIYRLLK